MRRSGPWRHALPLGLWMVLIAAFSGPLGSQETMRVGISWVLEPFTSAFGVEAPGAGMGEWTVWLLRKSLHMIEYGVLALLATRWFVSLDKMTFDGAVGGSLVLSTAYAAGDEFHQVFVPGRTGASGDIVIDALGASLVLAALCLQRAEGRDLAYRVRDVIGAGVGLVLSAPFMVIAAVVVRLHMGPPILFQQPRIGPGERPFQLYKFRTMGGDVDKQGRKLRASERVTRTGRILRSLSIDEFPQFWNVLRGDMSLVGPRPLFVHYLPYYTEREHKRHLVRPGLTGLAQIRGRNSTPWDERLEHDVEYVETQSFAGDLRILFRTVGKVVRRSDVLDSAIQGSLAEHREREKSRTGGPIRD
ncbi:MAG: VanZ family protein [Armatimonadetes bacterium]|nr:VanZ family protein [Armatimonadota bacterium]